MKISVLIVLAILAACQDYRSFAVDESIDRIPTQAKAMLVFERMVEDHYQVSFGNLFERTNIYFVRDEDCAIPLDGRCLGGVMWSCSEIYVAVDPDKPVEDLRVCRTQLLHEFGHCLRMEMGISDVDDNGRTDHSDLEFWQGVLWDAHSYACDRGW